LEREVWEETGLKVERGDVVTCESSFYFSDIKNEYYNSILMYYFCQRVGGELSIANLDEYEKDYAGMPKWIDLDDIKKIKFYNSIDSVKIINRAIKMIK
jgi:8-oxo-dGTP pyrophosphatase MutT (NUDIX family)